MSTTGNEIFHCEQYLHLPYTYYFDVNCNKKIRRLTRQRTASTDFFFLQIAYFRIFTSAITYLTTQIFDVCANYHYITLEYSSDVNVFTQEIDLRYNVYVYFIPFYFLSKLKGWKPLLIQYPYYRSIAKEFKKQNLNAENLGYSICTTTHNHCVGNSSEQFIATYP